MKSFKLMGFGPRKSKSGFTLIELLIVLVIIAILAGVIIMAVGGVFGTAKSAAYGTARTQIQNAVTAYSSNNSGSFPNGNTTTSASVSAGNCTGTCYIISFAAMNTTNGGMMRIVPDGTYGGTTANADNCGGNNASWTGCLGTSHYTWIMDQYGSVSSICVNGCPGGTANVTGYQNIWP